MLIFIISAAVLAYIFIGYPVLLWVASAAFGRSVQKDENHQPTVSILISAYNEEAVIRRKLENSLALDYPKEKLEIIVASEATDRTNEIAGEYAQMGVKLYACESREGKRATLYRTVPLAKGEIIIFSDANAIYEKSAIRKLVRNFADQRIGCVSGRLRYLDTVINTAGKNEIAYWEFEFFLKKRASMLFSLAGSGGVNGSIFAIRKELYNPIDKYRGDDLEISCRIELAGYGVVMENEAVSYEEPSKSTRHEFGRKVRLAAWNFRSTLMLLSEALSKGSLLTASLLFSHRLLRYTTPIWLLLFFLGSALSPGLKYAALAQLFFYATGVMGFLLEALFGKASRFFTIPFYFCMINCAALLGVLKGILCRSNNFWEKAR